MCESGARENKNKLRSHSSRGGRSIWTGATITPLFPHHFNPGVLPLWVLCVFSHLIPKHVACRDPNRQQVLMRDTQRDGRGGIDRWWWRAGERNCSAFCEALLASCHGGDVTAFFSLYLSLSPFLTLSSAFDVRSKAAVILFPTSPPPPSRFSLSLCQERGRAGRWRVMFLFWDESVVWSGGIFEDRPKGKKASVTYTTQSHDVSYIFWNVIFWIYITAQLCIGSFSDLKSVHLLY